MKHLSTIALTAMLSACAVIPKSNPPTITGSANSSHDNAPLSLSDLSGTSWVITHVGNLELVESPPATIRFTAGQLSGATGCNRFTGSYALNTTVLTLGQLATTRMACAEPMMTQENLLLAALKGHFGIALEGDVMTITSPSGQTLTLKKSN